MTPGLADTDARFMAAAIRLGRRMLGRTTPNPAVGALVVRDDGAGPFVVGRGWTQAGGRPHAEPVALREAGAAARGATLYISLEPCSHHGKTPPCADAIASSGVARVVTALEDPDPRVAGRGHTILREAGIEIATGILAEEAARANSGHFKRMRSSLPHVTLKLAISADGKIAHAGPKPAAITDGVARDLAHMLRAEADAILIGAGTAAADDPNLTCRLPGMAARSPIRVVLDGGLRTAPGNILARTAREVPVWLMTRADRDPGRAAALTAAGIRLIDTAAGGRGLDPQAVLQRLAAEGLTRVLVEGGASVARSLLEADLVDEVVLVEAPLALGEDALDALAGLPLETVTDSRDFLCLERRPVGPNMLRRYWRL